MRALQDQIRFRRGAAKASGYDVIDVENGGLTKLRESAILTPTFIAAKYLLAQRFGNR
ncbi:MAG TPA: hypothetical protein VM008_10580 [Phycisphaerae bacterium]|nr:hypothetical protein [Phycisphaerae bacterium]